LEQKPTQRKASRVTWLIFGLMVGIGLGAAINNFPVGLAVGIAFGAVLGGPPHKKGTSAGAGGDGPAA